MLMVSGKVLTSLSAAGVLLAALSGCGGPSSVTAIRLVDEFQPGMVQNTPAKAAYRGPYFSHHFLK